MPYTGLIEPGEPSPGRVSFHVPAGLTEEEVARAGYYVLQKHPSVELVVEDWFAGSMTMAKVLPFLLTMTNAVRGHGVQRRGAPAEPRRPAVSRAEVTRCRCPVCGAIAFVLGPEIVRCRVTGHGPMIPLSVG